MEPVIKKESAVQREGFEYYYSLGSERSYAKVALKFKKSKSTIELWGKTYKWQVRTAEREELRRKTAHEQAVVEKELDYNQRNLRIIRRGIIEHAKAIQKNDLTMSYRSLDALIEREKRIITGIDSNVEVNHKMELRGMTNDQIEKAVDERIGNLTKFKKLKKFEETNEPIDVEFKELSKEKKK